MSVLYSCLFALAVSVDGFGVGVAYGVKKIRIPLQSLLVICLASMTAIAASMLVGQGIAAFISPELAERIGAFALILMGGWFILEGRRAFSEENRENDQPSPAQGEDQTVTILHIRFLGIIVQILREPARADFDASGVISTREALFLGLALALDALGAGMGAAMSGLNVAITVAAVGICKFIVVNAGVFLGNNAAPAFMQKYASLLSGIILCGIGLFEICF